MEGNPYWKPTPVQWTIWGIAAAAIILRLIGMSFWIVYVAVLLMFSVAVIARRKRKAAKKSPPPEPNNR